MGKTLVVVEEQAGRPFLVTKKNKGINEQVQFTLHSGLKDSEIRQLVQQGVPLNCFEANPELGTIKLQEKAMKELARFAVGVADHQKRVSPTVRTELVDFGEPKKVVGPSLPAVNTEALELKLIKAGVNFELAEEAAAADMDALKKLDYKAIGKALGLKGNFGLQKVYDAIRV